MRGAGPGEGGAHGGGALGAVWHRDASGCGGGAGVRAALGGAVKPWAVAIGLSVALHLGLVLAFRSTASLSPRGERVGERGEPFVAFTPVSVIEPVAPVPLREKSRGCPRAVGRASAPVPVPAAAAAPVVRLGLRLRR